MASLSNINGLFDVHSTGAILFSTSHGTSGQILRSNGNAAPTWVAASTVIGGPYLPLTGGTLSGATATATGISFTVGGALAGTSASFTGKVISPRTSLNRGSNVASGYNYYNDVINGWQTYMAAQGQANVGYNGNLTAPTGTYVTSWAIRSIVEPNAGYGWTWEELANAATTGQSIIAELSSNNGNFKTIGNIYASGGNSTQWNAHTSNTGTVTSVATGNGLNGGTITSTGTLSMSGTYSGRFNPTGYQIVDTRAGDITPADEVEYSQVMHFTNQVPGLSGWKSLIQMKGWHDAYSSWQIIGPSDTTANDDWYLRSGVGTTWNTAREIWHTGNLTPNTGTVTSVTGNGLTGGTITTTGTLTMSGSYTGTFTATSLATNSFLNNAGNLLFSAGNTTTGASRSLNLRNSSGDPSSSDGSNSTGITWGQRTDSNPYYIIKPTQLNFGGGNYSKLTLNWHTGIRIGGQKSYGGTKFYNDAPDIVGETGVIMNVGVGNDNIGIVNALTVGGNATAASFTGPLQGNASTSTMFNTGRTNYKGVTDGSVIGQMMWKNYGNNHTIFDASSGTSPQGNVISNINSINAWGATYPTLMGWNGSSSYGVRVDSARVADSTTGSAASAGTLTHNANRVDSSSYPVVWMAGSPSPAYSCAAVTITSSAGRINANALQFNYTQHGSANNIRMGNSTTMNAISSGTNNAAFGVEALGGCSTGSRNFAYGYASLFSLSSGSSNIAMGDATGYNVTSGSNNLLFGQNAGRTGYQSPYQSIAGITTGSNQIHMGNESHSTARIQISWTVNSDSRDKTDVTPIDVGLDFVKDLNPVTFRWDKRSDYEDRIPTGKNKLEELTLGFLAQEVEEVEKSYGYDVANKTNLVVDRDVDQDHFGITYEKMIPILVKAIQELETRVKELENK